ncbi:TonB-dependent receptor [Sandaracinobacter sp. RS1-74]|uniref:TonB-dependent receptor n=1 Tax=Sandaracinobacteroides sayramensis TaxID=2913411 RepID=UPI001EDA933F|nr:TonB-dependent receptor [Sandaracinobacteroides sayramensis]MCG2839711.1 TonB-dependent receptor [Sandaracinobacteroides sayramensis]
MRKKGFTVQSSLSALIAGLGVLAMPAQAEADADAEVTAASSGEIVVTARKRDERLQDVPVAISTISGDTLARQQINRVSDFSAKLPNFGAVQQNTRVSGLYVRGLGGNANNDGAESGVGLIVDNVFYTHVGFSWLDFVDVENVELVRGPQGTLLGKNTTIGALIITTKKPSFEPEATVEAGYANFGRWQLRGNVSGPIIKDRLAFRITGYRDKSDGWITNAYDGQKFLDVNRWALRGQLLLELPTFTNRLIVERYETNEYNNFYPPFADANNFTNGTVRAASWERKLQTIFGFTPSYDYPQNANVNTQERISSKVWGISNQFDVQLGDHSITSVSAWRQLRFRPKNDSDNSPFSILRAGFDVDVDQYSQEIRLASPTGQTVDYQVGAFYLYEDLVSNNRSLFQSDATRWFLTGQLPPAYLLPLVLDGVEYQQRGSAKIESSALFGQGTWHATDRFDLTLGLRLSREAKSAINLGRSFGGTPLVGPLAALAPARAAVLASFGGTTPALAGNFRLADSHTTTGWSWLVNPSYKLSDDVLLYASVSHGEKSGAANLSATPGKPLLIDPEKSTAYEAGVKASFPGVGFLNANLYWNDITNFQATQVDPNRLALGSYLGNVGKVRLRGVELEGQVSLARGISLSANGAFNDARYVSYEKGPSPVEAQYPGAPTYVDWSGERVVGAPKWSGQVSLDADVPISSALHITGFANQTYRSAVNLSNPFSEYGRQEAYGLTNAGLGIRAADGRWSLNVWGRNLFDKTYFVGVGPANPVSPYIGVLGDPRTYGVTGKVSF